MLSNIPTVSLVSIGGWLIECRQVNFNLLSFPAVSYFSFHYDFEDFVEFVRGEAFDVIGASIEVPSNVCEDCEVGVEEAVSHSKISKYASRVGKPSRIRSSSVMACPKSVSTPYWAFSLRILIFSLWLPSLNFTYFIIMLAEVCHCYTCHFVDVNLSRLLLSADQRMRIALRGWKG